MFPAGAKLQPVAGALLRDSSAGRDLEMKSAAGIARVNVSDRPEPLNLGLVAIDAIIKLPI